MDVCMGGRVAEELVFGIDNVTSGASSDIQQVTLLCMHSALYCLPIVLQCYLLILFAITAASFSSIRHSVPCYISSHCSFV
jgi:Peptidase family M41